jgi:hypothetical protein
VFTKKVHVFKAGPQVSAQGVQREFSPDDLQEVVESYDSKIHEAPLVIGHSGDNDSTPSFGWIKGFSRKGDDLYANVEFTDAAKDLVKNGHYRKVSISFYSPESPINPHKGKWSARHLALLGAAPPAVKGLESLSFTEERGVFDFAVALSPDDIFSKELGPTMMMEKGPLEMLKERLDEVRNEMDQSLKQLEDNQNQQTEASVSETGSETTNSADQNATPDNPNQQFSEMKKKLGREGAEVAESAQQLANLETKAPETKFKETSKKKMVDEEEMESLEDESEESFKESAKAKKMKAAMADEDEMESLEDETSEKFEEGSKRKVSGGANGQKVQVVQEVFEEGLEEQHKERTSSMRKKLMAEEGDEEMDYDEVSHKAAKNGRVTFGTHSATDGDKMTGRSETARSKDDSYADRQMVGKGAEEDREGVTSDSEQDKDRVKTASDSEQDKDREKLAKSDEGDDSEDSRWAGQGDARKKVMNNDQYDDSDSDYPEQERAGVSDGDEPHGRDGGPTSVSKLSEEDPDDMEMAVDVKNVKGSKDARVLYQTSGQKRAALKGGSIADHAEGEDGEPDSEGVVKSPKKASVSSGKDARGRSGGPTDFPTISEEDPDNEEMAVKVGDATESDKVRIVRQKSGDKATLNHAEGEMSRRKKAAAVKDPMTETGKGSTYEEGEMDDEAADYSCGSGMNYGMGSTAQAKPMGMPAEMYEELKAVKAENERLKREFEEQKMMARKQKISHYVEGLYSNGQLTDAVITQGELQNFCEGLEFGTMEFSEGETPSSKLLGILSRLPNMVYFNEVVSNEQFEPSVEDMDPHERALEMVRRGEASDYLEAIKMAIPWTSRG